MKVKLLEIRDRDTLIPAMAIEMAPDYTGQSYLLMRAGYGTSYRLIMLMRLHGGQASYSAYSWGDRTMTVAHKHIEKVWDELNDGDVIDVEFILGETKTKKLRERDESSHWTRDAGSQEEA